MAQATTITVNDRKTTPAAHVFKPMGNGSEGSYNFAETSSVKIGENKLSVRWRKSRGNYYCRVMLTLPVLVTETINGVAVPSVTRVSLVDANFRFSESSTDQERKDTVGMFANLLAANQATMMSTLVDLEGIWG